MTNLKENTLSITEKCYQYMVENNVDKLNIYDFIDYIKSTENLDEDTFYNQISYFYTDLNLDGRFVCVEDGKWMLKDKLSVIEIEKYVEPSINTYSIEEDDEDEEKDEEEDEDIQDKNIDEEKEDEEDDVEQDELFCYDTDNIVSKFSVEDEKEEF